MKNFKNILASIALLSIGAIHAKQVKKTTTTTPYQPAPIQPSSSQPTANKQSTKTQSAKAKTFEQLYYEVKNTRNAWDNKTQLLNQTFVDNLVKDAINADIDKEQLKILLEIARYRHAQFTGPRSDIDILNKLTDQFIAAVESFDEAKKTN